MNTAYVTSSDCIYTIHKINKFFFKYMVEFKIMLILTPINSLTRENVVIKETKKYYFIKQPSECKLESISKKISSHIGYVKKYK